MGEVEETLAGLGLTSLQAKIYVALMSLNDATVKDISKVAKVARQEIYRALSELLKLGVIEKKIAVPNRFRAVPLKETLEFLLERRKNQTAELEAKTAKIIKIAKVPQKSTRSDYDFLLLEGKEIVLRSSENFGLNSQKIRILYESTLTTYWLINQFQLYLDTLKRGTRIQLLIDKPQDNSPIIEVIRKLKKNPLFEIRYLQRQPSIIFVVYDHMGLLPISPVEEAVASKEYIPHSLCSNHPAFMGLLGDYFDNLWEKALENGDKHGNNQLSSRISKIKQGSPWTL
jgi:sugar-specific transcriptional regulator TrmB